MPQVLINREQLPHLNFDVELLGDCDVIVNELCHQLGGEYEQLCSNIVRLSEITEKPPRLLEQPHNEAFSASKDAAHEEQKPHSTDSITKPLRRAETLNVTEAAANITPPQPCSNPQCPREEPTDPVAVFTEGSPTEAATEVKNQPSNLEFHRRCWMNRISRSPLSKRLESKLFKWVEKPREPVLSIYCICRQITNSMAKKRSDRIPTSMCVLFPHSRPVPVYGTKSVHLPRG